MLWICGYQGKRVRAKQHPTVSVQPLYQGLQLMPSLHRFPDEAVRIGRIVAAFSELEFILALCLGEVLNDRDTALRTIFQLASGRARIDALDALLRPAYGRYVANRST
jgi:hypothetical protein